MKNLAKWWEIPPFIQKIVRIMKISVFLVLACTMQLSASVMLGQKLSVQGDEMSVRQVFKELKTQTGTFFMYSEDEIIEDLTIDLDFSNVSLEVVLDEICEQASLQYEIVDNYVLITKKAPVVEQPIQQEKKELKGTVRDEDGYPLPGVSVVVKGTTTGVATDMDGNFMIQFENENAVLVFSFVSMITQEVTSAGQNVINIILKQDTEQVGEVVVTGFFNKKKGSFTGAVKTMNSDEIARIGNQNIMQCLEVLDPSFSLVENLEFGSDPNNVPDILIRGKNNFLGSSNDPTFILDGFETTKEKIFDEDPNNFESVTILKDASATALYGSKGANGVIIFTRKKAKPGETQFTLNSSMSIDIPDLTDYNLMNGAEKFDYEFRAGEYAFKTAENQLDYLKYQNEVLRGVDTYWLSQPLEVAVGHKHSLRIEGGGEFIRYGIDMTYRNKPGVMKDSKRETKGVAFSLSYNMKNKLLFRNVLSVDMMNSEDSPYGSFSEYASANPYERIKDENGNFIPKFNFDNNNPLYNASLNNLSTKEYLRADNNFSLDWTPNNNWKISAEASISAYENKSDEFKSPFHTDFYYESTFDKRGYYKSSNSNSLSYYARLMASYMKSIGKHNISAGIGASADDYTDAYKSNEVTGFTNDKIQNISLAQRYKENTVPYGLETTSRSVKTFGNLQYIYDNRLVLNVNYSVEGSSKFGRNNRYGGFGSAGFAWNIHKEKFMSSLESVVNSAKLRGSIGFTGNQNFAAYQSLLMYEYDVNKVYRTGPGVYIMGLGNYDLKWEKVLKRNIGLDLDILNKFNLVVDFYKNTTSDMVIPVTLPGSAGTSSYVENYGEAENSGFDISLRSTLVKTDDFLWTAYLSVSHNQDKITKIGNKLDSYNSNLIDNETEGNEGYETKPVAQYAEGQSMYDIKVVRSAGIDPQTGKELYIKKDGSITYVWDEKDKVIQGNSNPDYRGVISTGFNYKGFDLNISMNYRFGGQRYNSTLIERVETADPLYNADRRILDVRWEKPGDHAYFRDMKLGKDQQHASSRFVEDDDNMSLSSISLSYRSNSERLKNIGLKSLRLGVSLNSIYKWSTMEIERGVNYPFARTVNCSLTARF